MVFVGTGAIGEQVANKQSEQATCGFCECPLPLYMKVFSHQCLLVIDVEQTEHNRNTCAHQTRPCHIRSDHHHNNCKCVAIPSRVQAIQRVRSELSMGTTDMMVFSYQWNAGCCGGKAEQDICSTLCYTQCTVYGSRTIATTKELS